VRERFGLRCCRETIRAALRRLDLSWKKAKKLLSRADPEKRHAFVKHVEDLLAGAQRDRYLLVYWDEAHIHQETDLGYGWAPRGQRLWVTSCSPGLSAKLSFYGLYLYNQGAVRLWPYPRANSMHTIEALRRLRAGSPDCPMIVLWDGAPYHRAACVREAAAALHIDIVPLPGYSPDFMPVEALWRGLREDVSYHYCHPTSEDLCRRVGEFEADINQDPYTVADRLMVKDHLDPEEEKLRFSN
jgi:transposase